MRVWIDKENEMHPNAEWNDSYVFTLTRKKYSTIFSGITDTWYRMDCMAIPEIYEDLFIIGISVFAIDKRVSRRLFPDCWTRELSVSIPVLQMSKWHGTEEYWNQTLGFLTGDKWDIHFRQCEKMYSKREYPNRIHLDIKGCDCICLFSGGLDSFCGAIKLLEEGMDIPKDVTANSCEFTHKEPELIRTVTRYNEEEVKEAARLINESERPIVYFGGGVRSAAGCQPLRDLLEKTGMPATHTLMAAGVLGYGEPHNLGMLGMHGCYAANKAVSEADLVIAVGARFSDRVALNPNKFASKAKIIQIDIDPSELGKNVDVDLALAGDASYILQAILPYVEKTEHKIWMEQIREWQRNDYHPKDSFTELKPHQIINEICEQAGPEAVYVTDVGQHQMWAAQYLHHTKSRGFLTSGGLGTMGFGYGAAIGAQVALGNDHRVVMLTGDGSFHMNLNEGCTAVSYELPIITVIFDNQVLGMVRQWQTSFYGKRYSNTDPQRRTDFVKLAEAFGAKGYRATNIAEFKAAFADAMKQKGPSWIDCRIGKDEKVLPMIPGGGDINDIIME